MRLGGRLLSPSAKLDGITNDAALLTIDKDVTITGDLTVSGDILAELKIDDNIIVLNNDVTGAPSQNAGIEVERGTSANASILWNETDDIWYAGISGSEKKIALHGTDVNFTGATIGTLAGIIKGTAGVLGIASAGADYLAPTGSGAGLTGIIWSQIGSTPTTLSGYGITDAFNPASPGAIGGTTPSTGLFTSLGIGTGIVAPTTKLQVVETVSTSPRGIMSSQFCDTNNGARFHMRKGRGTLAAPTVVVSGDNLGRLVASGYDGAAYQEMASIIFGTEGTIAAGRVPTNMSFWTATNAATSVLTERMRIDSAGTINTYNGNMILKATYGTELITAPMVTGGWTLGYDTGGWTITAGVLSKTASTGTLTATAVTGMTSAPVVGTTYKVVIVCSAVSGTLTYSLGGITGTTITATTITDYITAATTAKIILSGTAAVTTTITSISITALTDATGDLTVDGNLTVRSPMSVACGNSTSPSIYPGTETTNGFYFVPGGITFIGTPTASNMYIVNLLLTNYVRFGADTFLTRDAANVLAQRNIVSGTTAQTFRIYETCTDASNYEMYSLDAGVTTADTLTISALSAGTGSANLNIALKPKGTGAIQFGAACTSYAEMAADPAGVADRARIFAKDNGAGKTQLMVIFGSGAAIQLAIEA